MSSLHGLPCSSPRGNIHTEILRFLTTRLAETGPSSHHPERALLVPSLRPAGKLLLRLAKQAVLPGNGFPFSTRKGSRRHHGESFSSPSTTASTRPHPAHTAAPGTANPLLKVLWTIHRKNPSQDAGCPLPGTFPTSPAAAQAGRESFGSHQSHGHTCGTDQLHSKAHHRAMRRGKSAKSH